MISELQQVRSDTDGALWVGSMVTHSQLAHATVSAPELRNLHSAAAKSANPNVRNVATVGGNICATGFSAADLVPALMSLDAEVSYTDRDGDHTELLASYIPYTSTTRVVRGVRIPTAHGTGAHIRLPLRAAGDYPVSIVTGTLALHEGVVSKTAIALGAVEEHPRRWTELEAALTGRPLDAVRAEEAARDLVSTLVARTSVGTPAQYRLAVTPSLVRKFVEKVLRQAALPVEVAAS
jgi:carbon-monoxide dehydrogenase medium subunit